MKIAYCLDEREVKCKCGCGQWMNLTTLLRWSIFRLHRNEPITIFSGCRCKYQNEKSKGATKSQHLYGKALDLKVPEGETIESFAQDCRKYFPVVLTEYVYKGTLIKYKDHVHVDTRSDNIDTVAGLKNFLMDMASIIASLLIR